jgi:hypothetical protein
MLAIIIGAGVIALGFVIILPEIAEQKSLNYMQLRVFIVSLVLLLMAAVAVIFFLP